MPRVAITFILLLCSVSVRAEDTDPSPELLAAARTLQFIADVSIYEGYFLSVVDFCRPHVQPAAVDLVKGAWLAKNGAALELRDRELQRLHRNATAGGAAKEKLDELTLMPETYRNRAIQQDRMVRDLRRYTDLEIRCSKRLGEMLSNGMRMENIVPNTETYMGSKREP